MLSSIQRFVLLVLLSLPATGLFGQGLVVNELSNGTSGSKEFLEFVVIGSGANESCGPVNIQGWVIDDNNGDFACGPCASTGISNGHMRFASVAQWATVPVGSIILIYNDGDVDAFLPAADPNDTAPQDSVYVIPSGHASIEYSTGSCTNTPTGFNSCGFCSGVSGYAGACYASTNLWGNVILRNQGDAVQIRRPNATYFHGFAYGTPGNNMSGGPDGLINPITGTNLSFFFGNTSSNNYRLASNWGSTTGALATPGQPNTVNNRTWIDFLLTDCTLPVEYALALEAKSEKTGTQLRWATQIESASSHFNVMRAVVIDGEFESIGTVPAAGQSSSIVNYEFLDANPPKHAFYRLEQVDLGGKSIPSHIVEVYTGKVTESDLKCWPQPTNSTLHYEIRGNELRRVILMDALGRTLERRDLEAGTTVAIGEMSMAQLVQGVYFLEVQSADGTVRKKILHMD